LSSQRFPVVSELGERQHSDGTGMQSIAKGLGMKERGGEIGNPPPPEESVDSRTAAAFLRIHPKTLERRARKGQIPAMKFGKEWQYLLSLLSEWARRANEFEP
jgi:hypothetical protein